MQWAEDKSIHKSIMLQANVFSMKCLLRLVRHFAENWCLRNYVRYESTEQWILCGRNFECLQYYLFLITCNLSDNRTTFLCLAFLYSLALAQKNVSTLMLYVRCLFRVTNPRYHHDYLNVFLRAYREVTQRHYSHMNRWFASPPPSEKSFSEMSF